MRNKPTESGATREPKESSGCYHHTSDTVIRAHCGARHLVSWWAAITTLTECATTDAQTRCDALHRACCSSRYPSVESHQARLTGNTGTLRRSSPCLAVAIVGSHDQLATLLRSSSGRTIKNTPIRVHIFAPEIHDARMKIW